MADSEYIPKGPINTNRAKADLQSIAKSLGLDTEKKTRANLVTEIQGHIAENHQSLAANPKFQLLVAASGRATSSTASVANKKTSADKAKEDDVQSSKSATQLPTGANKKLLDRNVKTDPPAQHGRLGVPSQANMRVEDVKDEDSDNTSDDENAASSALSSPKSLPGVAPSTSAVEGSLDDHDADKLDIESRAHQFADPEVQGEIKPLAVTIDGTSPPREAMNEMPIVASSENLVRVNFYKASDPNAGANEVYLDNVHIEETVTEGPQGRTSTYSVKLSNVLPLAIAQDSPMKKRGRIFRQGLGGSGNRINLGTVQAITSSDTMPAPFKIQAINNYILRNDHSGIFGLDLYVDDDTNTDNSPGNTSPIKKLPPQPGASKTTPTKSSTPAKTSTTSDKPLIQARELIEKLPELRKDNNDERAKYKEGFHSYLREVTGVVNTHWPSITNVGQVLERRLAVVRALERLDALRWRAQKAYTIPASDPKFPGYHFTKDDVYDALKIGRSKGGNDAKLFDDAVFRADPRIKEWYGSSDPTLHEHDVLFGSMSIKKFKEHVTAKEQELEEEKYKKRDKERRKELKGERKKRDKKVRKREESDVEDTEERSSKKHRGKDKKNKPSTSRMDSEDLD